MRVVGAWCVWEGGVWEGGVCDGGGGIHGTHVPLTYAMQHYVSKCSQVFFGEIWAIYF